MGFKVYISIEVLCERKYFLFSRINQPQTPAEAEDGPPELLVRLDRILIFF